MRVVSVPWFRTATAPLLPARTVLSRKVSVAGVATSGHLAPPEEEEEEEDPREVPFGMVAQVVVGCQEKNTQEFGSDSSVCKRFLTLEGRVFTLSYELVDVVN